MKSLDEFIERLWKKLSSIKLAIFLFIVIASTSIIGTLLVQNRPSEEYIKLFGTVGYQIMEFLGFFDLYHSFWFRFLLLLFALNLLLCSIERLPSLFSFLKSYSFIKNPSGFKNLSIFFELKLPGGEEEIVRRIERVLGKRGFRFWKEEGEGIFFYGRRGTFSRFGPYLTHLGMLIVFAGAYVGSVSGFRARVNILEGEIVNTIYESRRLTPIPLGFGVKCVKFSIEKYPGTDVPKEYLSELEIHEDGRVVLKRVIEVNKPLSYKGLKFYQSSYGISSVKEVVFQVIKKNGANELILSPGEEKFLDGVSIKLERFFENYMGLGATAIITVTEKGRKRTIPVFHNKEIGAFHRALDDGEIFIKDFAPLYYTGLEVTRDPGVNIVWTGCVIGILGMFLAFYFPFQRVYISLFNNEKKLLIGGSVSKGRNLSFVEEIYRELKEGGIFNA